MRLISIKVSEEAYAEFKDYAARRGQRVADLMREAIAFYIDRQIRSARKMRRLPTTSKPKLYTGPDPKAPKRLTVDETMALTTQ